LSVLWEVVDREVDVAGCAVVPRHSVGGVSQQYSQYASTWSSYDGSEGRRQR